MIRSRFCMNKDVGSMIIMISETIYQEEEKMDTKNYFVVDSVE